MPQRRAPIEIPKEVKDAFETLNLKMMGFVAFIKKGAVEVNENSVGFTDKFVKKTNEDSADSSKSYADLKALMDLSLIHI